MLALPGTGSKRFSCSARERLPAWYVAQPDSRMHAASAAAWIQRFMVSPGLDGPLPAGTDSLYALAASQQLVLQHAHLLAQQLVLAFELGHAALQGLDVRRGRAAFAGIAASGGSVRGGITARALLRLAGTPGGLFQLGLAAVGGADLLFHRQVGHRGG